MDILRIQYLIEVLVILVRQRNAVEVKHRLTNGNILSNLGKLLKRAPTLIKIGKLQLHLYACIPTFVAITKLIRAVLNTKDFYYCKCVLSTGCLENVLNAYSELSGEHNAFSGVCLEMFSWILKVFSPSGSCIIFIGKYAKYYRVLEHKMSTQNGVGAW